MTLDELAVGLRRSKQTVASWAAQGVIPRNGTLLECALAAMDYFAEVKAGRRGRPSEDGAEVFDLATERARLAKEQADGQSMKNLELSGELMRRGDVKTSWANMALSFKEKVRSAPLVAMTQIPGFTKPMAKKLAEILDVALVELADGGTRNRTGKRSPRPRARNPRVAKAAAEANGKRVG